jgi:hypothetical protein
MAYPKRVRGTEICITVSRDGTTIYGNKAAFRELSRWMNWIAESDSAEHYECHLPWHLDSYFAKRKRVWVLIEKGMLAVLKRTESKPKFEVTFMAVTGKELRALRRHERRGTLPDDWSKQ